MRFHLKYGNSRASRIISLMVMLCSVCVQISTPMHGDITSSSAKPADVHSDCHSSDECDTNASHVDESECCNTGGCEGGDCESRCCQHVPMQSLLPSGGGSIPAPLLARVIIPVHALLPGSIPVPFLPPRA